MARATHHLKTWPEYFEKVLTGHKTFEIRENDRDFYVGDTLHLMEFEPDTLLYTGRDCNMIVTYMTDFEQVEDFVVMAIKPPTQIVIIT